MESTDEMYRRLEQERFAMNLQTIRDAKLGSDLYGVLEKTAFHLSLLRPQAKEDKNWFDAQFALAVNHTRNGRILELFKSEEYYNITGHIKRTAEGINEELRELSKFVPLDLFAHTDLMYWMAAQDSIAESAASSFKILYDLDVGKIKGQFPSRA